MIFFKKIFFPKSENLHKSNKIYRNFWVILEDEGFKTVLECIIYIEMNKKVPYKIVQKICFIIDKLIINKS